MSESKVIGKPISDEVFNQILKRQEKIGSLNRDVNTIYFMNSNKCWIKLSSGVNTLSAEDEDLAEESPDKILGDATLASSNVLGFSATRGGIDDSVNTNPLYRLTDSRGFKAEPGIISATVRSKGTYGTLRETEVRMVVWSLEDLDLIEKLYLRPGFSMLLEWGHTAYFTQDEFRTSTQTISNFFSKYTSENDESAQFLIQKEIDTLRKESNYNYDGVFGYVKNFSWSLRPDGGYDCSIFIASVGSLIEGLRADIGIQNVDAEDILRNTTEENRESLKSPFHYIILELEDQPNFDFNGSLKYYRNSVGSNSIKNFFKKVSLPDDVIIYQKKTTSFSIPYIGALLASNSFWFPLSLVFDIINQFISLKTKDGKTIEIYSGARDKNQEGDYEIEAKYTTSDYHFSLNPYRVQLPKQHKVLDINNQDSDFIKKYLGNIMLKVNGSQVPFGSQVTFKKGASDDILNILIGGNVLLEIFDRNVNEPDSQNRDLKSILDNFCSVLNDELGGVNEFDFHFDEKRNLFILVDRKNTPYEQSGNKYPQLQLTGLKSTVEQITLNSKLSNKVSSQIAIAAQGSSNNYQENVSEILKWNSGVVDRHGVGGTYEIGQENSEDAYSEERERRINWLKTASNIYKTNGDSATYDASLYNELKPYHRIYMSSYVLDELIALGQPPKGIIPVELSFTMLGVSGIDIAEAFKIAPGILPTKYSDMFGFIITGLEHNIGSKWTTTFKTQFYILDKPTEAEKQARRGFLGEEANTESPPPINSNLATPNADQLRFVLNSLNYLEEGREISSGGDIQEITYKMGKAVFTRLKQVLPENTTIVVTGGNDRYHQENSKTSRHIAGRGLDFKVAPNNKANLALVEGELQYFMVMNDPKFRYINEYETPTALSTGGHFHISWGEGRESANLLEEVRNKKGADKYILSPSYIIV